MKYLVMILGAMLLLGSGLFYWYYTDSQEKIGTLRENNGKLETGIQLNEETIRVFENDLIQRNETIAALNEELRQIRRQNQLLVDKFADSDIGIAAAARPELVERLINRGTENAFRCFELISGAELTERERNATNGREFNNECPWLFDDLVRP